VKVFGDRWAYRSVIRMLRCPSIWLTSCSVQVPPTAHSEGLDLGPVLHVYVDIGGDGGGHSGAGVPCNGLPSGVAL
jgi:hypothetical protein